MKRTPIERTFIQLLIKVAANSKEAKTEPVWEKIWLEPIAKMAPEVVLAAEEVIKE